MKKLQAYPRILFFGSVLILSIISSCGEKRLEVNAPKAIQQKITQLQNAPVQNPPAEVWRWRADNAIYYYVTSGCFDQFNYLYDESGEVVCAPDGGFTGKGAGDCPNFQGPISKTLIWRDNR